MWLELLILLATGVAVVAVVTAVGIALVKLFRRDDGPKTEPLGAKLKPEDPRESTRELRLAQFQRGPGEGNHED